MEMKLHMTPDQVVERAVKAVKLAREYTDDVEFSAEDASRSDPAFLAGSAKRLIKARRHNDQPPGHGGLRDP